MPLYQCRTCGAVHRMASKGSELFCTACGAGWRMDEYGTLRQINAGDGEGSSTLPEIYIPDWYEWQRENVRRRIAAEQYCLEIRVRVEALPNAVNFIDCGAGRLTHGPGGFDLTFVDYEDGREKTLHFSSASMSSIHTEYDYRGKGQCVTLSVPDNTYFLFPLEEGFNATEIQFAVEEFFERSHS